MDDELKRKAEFYLKQVWDISKAATKTAFISFAALAIIWATQIKPQYNRLVEFVYPSLPRLKQELGEQILNLKRSELESAVTSIPFDIFGLKIPVKPLFAAVVWDLALLAVLLYLARARSSIWALCANALFVLKRSGRNSEDIHDIAGHGL